MYTLYCGDNVEIMQNHIKDNSIDMILTSPPYDILTKDLITIPNQARSYEGYDWDFVTVANESYRVLKDGGVLVWVVGDVTIDGSETGTPERQKLYFMDIGFKCHDTMIYQKSGPPKNHKRYEQHFEYMYVFVKGNLKTFNGLYEKALHAGTKITSRVRENGDDLERSHGFGKRRKKTKLKSNIWYFDVGFNKTTKDKIAFKHSAVFPEKLAYDHIYSWTNEGDTVLDIFCGSGTTGKMAIVQNREFIGIDCSEEYIAITKERLADQHLPMFDKPHIKKSKQISLF